MTLPDGFGVRLVEGIVAADGGKLLVGGSPLTALRLTDRARALLGPAGVTVTDGATRHLASRLLATNLGEPDLSQVDGIAPYDLTVVIPTRDRPEQLDRALAAVQPLRCIVVDDASRSPEPVAEVARRYGAVLVRLMVNVGPAAARNAGLTTVTTPYVAFVDSDVEVGVGALLALSCHFADPDVALVGPRVVGFPRSVRPRWFERYDAVASSLSLGRTPSHVRPGAAVAWLPGACLVGRTCAVSGGFDADLRVGEDVDLVWRLVADGHTVRFDPTVEARHDARRTLRGWLGRKFVYGSGGGPLAERHGNLLAPAVLSPTYAVAAAVLLLRRTWSIPVALLALTSGVRSVRGVLPNVPGRTQVAGRLAVRGLGWAVRQESALLLRHWWPAAALGAAASRNVRRAIATALVVDMIVAVSEHSHPDCRLDPATLWAGRRLDDLAYGAGLWWGAMLARSPRVLCPRRPPGAARSRSGLLPRWRARRNRAPSRDT